jgi:hypothetical protein
MCQCQCFQLAKGGVAAIARWTKSDAMSWLKGYSTSINSGFVTPNLLQIIADYYRLNGYTLCLYTLTVKTIQNTAITVVSLRSKFACRHLHSRADNPVPSQGHYGFHSFPVVDWFCLFIYLWVLTFLCKIVRSSVILLLPLFNHCIS